MLKMTQKQASLKRTNPLYTHNILNSKKTVLSPRNLRSLSRQFSSSPSKQSCLTPSHRKTHKTPSKLFRKAHQTVQGETYLHDNTIIQHFPSSAKPTVFRDTLKNKPKVNSGSKLTIRSVYSICICERVHPLQSLQLSQIIRGFEPSDKQKGMANITENSDQLLQINSKLSNSLANSSSNDLCL